LTVDSHQETLIVSKKWSKSTRKISFRESFHHGGFIAEQVIPVLAVNACHPRDDLRRHFSRQRTCAVATGPFGAIIAWRVAAGGIYSLARDARVCFGNYLGFLAAFVTALSHAGGSEKPFDNLRGC